jgi:hypothetical protein
MRLVEDLSQNGKPTSEEGRMGIDVQLEPKGRNGREVADPNGLLRWLLSMSDLDGTACLRFIDDYGETVFNRLQLPVLRDELIRLRPLITDATIRVTTTRYLEKASAWPDAARRKAASSVPGPSVEELSAHLEEVLQVVTDGVASGPHHYVRFVGD